MYPEKELMVIPEGNDENDMPSSWSMLVADYTHLGGKKHYIFVEKNEDEHGKNIYTIENSWGENLCHGTTFRTLAGAKKRAEQIAYTQETQGVFTD